MYFVVTDNYFPLKGSGWYFDDVVAKAIGYNLIKREDIKYQVKASYALQPTHFRQFVDKVYETFEPAQSDGGKLAINGFVGLLGKTPVSKQQVYFESDYNAIVGQVFANDNVELKGIYNEYYRFASVNLLTQRNNRTCGRKLNRSYLVPSCCK